MVFPDLVSGFGVCWVEACILLEVGELGRSGTRTNFTGSDGKISLLFEVGTRQDF